MKAGRTFCLSLPLDYPGGSTINPRRTPPELMPTIREGRPNMAVPLRCYDPNALDVICDDRVLLTLQYSTQWDSLAHVGQMFDGTVTPVALQDGAIPLDLPAYSTAVYLVR